MKLLLAVIILMLSVASVKAEVLWQDFSVTYLKGKHYRVDDPQKQVLTFEHAAATSWGDSFFFLDHMRSKNGQRENYAEWAPRLSLSKLSDNELQFGIIKEVLFSSMVEMSALQTNFLYGIATDLSIPGFNYFNLNFLRRNNDGVAD